jgi:hypothetical protein
MLFCPRMTVPSSNSAPRVITSSVQMAGNTVEPWGIRDTRLQRKRGRWQRRRECKQPVSTPGIGMPV